MAPVGGAPEEFAEVIQRGRREEPGDDTHGVNLIEKIATATSNKEGKQAMSKSSSAPNYSLAADAPLNVRPITPAIGAEIHGVRLSGDLPAATVAAIRDALLRHRVVFFRGQGHLDEAEHQAFARLLGPLVPHPTVPSLAGTEAVLDIDAENARARYWHTDVTFVPAFPLFSVLRGVVIPPVGGDTVWANAVAAYDTLPAVLRGLADQLWALHSNAYDYAATRPDATARQVQRYETVFKSTVYETEHPVVQVHPLTGKRAIPSAISSAGCSTSVRQTQAICLPCCRIT